MQLTNRIHFRNLRGDIFGGVTAAIIALPMALAFGVASGAGAAAGLWGAVLVGFFAALFGGTPTLISEPTGPMTVVMTAVIANLTASNPENGLAMAFTVAFALTLVVYAFAFGTPLRPSTRVVLLVCSPLVAMLCNVIRLVPTSIIFGYGSVEAAERFHDAAGWVMLAVALVILAGVLRTIRWLEFPVTSFRLANQ